MSKLDIYKDIWCANAPKAYVDNRLVSMFARRKFSTHSNRMAGLSKVVPRQNRIDNEREHIQALAHIVEGI